MQYHGGKIIFYPVQKGITAQTAAALEYFKPLFLKFSTQVQTCMFDYSKFPLSHMERDDGIKTAMANRKVFASCNNVDSSNKQIRFLGMTSDDLHEAIDLFQSTCMPLKNTALATFGIDGKHVKVTVVHGDFQRQQGDALLSEMDEQGRSRIPLPYLVPADRMITTSALIQQAISSNRTLFETGDLKGKVSCEW